MPDSFRTLPPEILHLIIQYIDDDEDRMHLFMASKHLRQMFLSKPDLPRYKRYFELYGRPSFGARLQRLRLDFFHELYTADVFEAAFEDLRSSALKSFRSSQNFNYNEAGNIFIVVMPSVDMASFFAKFVATKIRTQGDSDWLHLHFTGGYMTSTTIDRFRKISKRETAIIIITNRTGGTLMRPNKIFYIAPNSSDVVHYGLNTGPSAAAIYWPLSMDRCNAYVDVTDFCRKFDRARCFESLAFRSKPELLYLREG